MKVTPLKVYCILINNKKRNKKMSRLQNEKIKNAAIMTFFCMLQESKTYGTRDVYLQCMKLILLKSTDTCPTYINKNLLNNSKIERLS